jgi:pimeloyl-ACP methyl ester carboxylesterase
MIETKAPMEVWEGLARFSRRLELPRGRGSLFFYDSAAAGPGQGAALPDIVLIHGLGDEADSFRSLFPLLAERRRVLAPDLPGFGRSMARGRVTFRSCLRALRHLVEAECRGPAILVGSSLGAALAEALARAAPGLCAGLVLMDGGLPTPPTSGSGILSMLLPIVGERHYRSLRGAPEAAYRSLEPYYADLASLPEAERSFLARRVAARVESDSQMRAYFSLLRSLAALSAFGQGRWRRFLSGDRPPLLVLWGSDDQVLPRAGAELLLAAAGRAQADRGSQADGGSRPPEPVLRIMEGAGHLPHQERPRETAAAIEEFLERD